MLSDDRFFLKLIVGIWLAAAAIVGVSIIAALALLPRLAHAQGAVQQQSPVTPSHLAMWLDNGQIADAGGSTGPGLAPGNNANAGTLPSGLGIVQSGLGYCQFSAYASLPYDQFCLGFDGAGNALISISGVGTASNPGFNISLNGLLYSFPGPGYGNVIGPATTTINEPVVWNSTGGTLVADGLGANIAHSGNLQVSAAATNFSTANTLYLSGYTQTGAVVDLLALSAAITDTAGSFQDALYSSVADQDTTAYTYSHTDYAGRFAAFGAYSSGWQTGSKNIVGLNAYALAATTSTPNISGYAPGVSGINADAFQYGAGIGDNEFAAHNLASGSGGIGHSISLAGVQAIIDSDYAANDSTHTAYGVLASNIGTQRIAATYGYSGSGTQASFIDSGNASVTAAAIYMPHSASGCVGSIIDYGTYNGAPVGGSYTDWCSGNFGWVDGGVGLKSLGTTGDIDFVPLRVYLNPAAPDLVATLEVVAADNSSAVVQALGVSFPGFYEGVRVDGTAASPQALAHNETLALFESGGYQGSAYALGTGGMSVVAAGDWTPSATPTYLLFSTIGGASTTETVRFIIFEGAYLYGAAGGDEGYGTFNVPVGYYLNGNQGLTQTCTVNQALTLIFTGGILTGGSCNS